jgi:hypothetical protein
MESMTDNYYNLIGETETAFSENLLAFQEYDLESNDTNIDLKALLNIS